MDKELLEKIYGFLQQKGNNDLPDTFDVFASRMQEDRKVSENVYKYLTQFEEVGDLPDNFDTFHNRIFGKKKAASQGGSDLGLASGFDSSALGDIQSQMGLGFSKDYGKQLYDRSQRMRAMEGQRRQEEGLQEAREYLAQEPFEYQGLEGAGQMTSESTATQVMNPDIVEGLPNVDGGDIQLYDLQTFEPVNTTQEGFLQNLDKEAMISHGTSFEELSSEHKAALAGKIKSRYISPEAFRDFLNDNGYNLTTGQTKNVLNRFARGGIGASIDVGRAGAQMLMGTANVAQDIAMGGQAPRVSMENKQITHATQQALGSRKEEILNQFQVNPKYNDDFWLSKLPEGAGSIVPFFLSGGMPGAAAIGAGMNAMGQYDKAIAAGEDPATAMRSFFIGAGVGASEALVMGKMAERLFKASPQVKENFFKKAASESGQEALQEASTEFLNNLSDKVLYDETKNLLDGLAESAAVGGVLGGGMSMITQSIEDLRARAAKVEDPQLQGQIEEAIQQFEEEELTQIIEEQEQQEQTEEVEVEEEAQNIEPQEKPSQLEDPVVEEDFQAAPNLASEGIPSSPATEVGELEGGQERQRKTFPSTIDPLSEQGPEFKDAAERVERLRFYNQISTEKSVAEAKSIIDQVGPDKALQDIQDTSMNIPGRVRVKAAQVLMGIYAKQVREAENDQVREEAVEKEAAVLDWYARAGTDFGQAVQAFRFGPQEALMNASHEGRMGLLQKDEEKTIRKKLEQVAYKQQELIDQLNQIKTEAYEEVQKSNLEFSRPESRTGNPEERTAESIGNQVQQEPEGQRSPTHQQGDVRNQTKPATKERSDDVVRRLKGKKKQIQSRKKEALDRWRKSIGGSAHSSGMSPEAISAMADYGVALVAEGVVNIEIWYRQMQDVFGSVDPADLRKVWNTAVEGKTIAQYATEGRETKLVEEFAKRADIDLNNLIKESLENQGAKRDYILDYIQRKYEVDLPYAQQFLENIEKAYKEVIDQKTRTWYNKKIGNLDRRGQKRRTPEDYEKVLEAQRVGVFDDNPYLLADLLGIEGHSEATWKKLDKYSKALDKLSPENRRAQQIMRDINTIQTKGDHVETFDLAFGIYYANMLSGLNTQVINFTANAVNLAAESFWDSIATAIAVKDYKALPGLLTGSTKEMGKGLYGRGLDEFIQIMNSGFEPQKGMQEQKQGSVGALERVNKEMAKEEWLKGPKNYARAILASGAIPGKYVGRTMLGTDMVFYHGAKAISLHNQALQQAHNEGFRGKQREDRVKQILYNPDNLVEVEAEIAEMQREVIDAGLEPFTDREVTVMRYDLLERKLGEDMESKADEFAKFATFNYDPEGILGAFARAVGALQNHENPAVSSITTAIFPFTRVVANVTNQALGYTPWGFVRVWGAKSKFATKSFKDWDKAGTEYTKMMLRAGTGILMMGVLAALHKSFEDDDDPWFAVIGEGPREWQKKNELYNTGWRPFSLKFGDTYISYKEYNSSLAFAFVAAFLESGKYGTKDNEDAAILSMLTWPQLIFSQSFLSGAEGAIKMVSSKKEGEDLAEDTVKYFGKIGQTFVPILGTRLTKDMEQIAVGAAGALLGEQKQGKTIYRSDNLWQALQKNMPVARRYLKPDLNAFGEEVSRKGNRLWTINHELAGLGSGEIPEHWQLVARKNLFIGLPSKRNKVAGIPLQDFPDALYDYQKERGKQLLRLFLKNKAIIGKLPDEKAQSFLENKLEKQANVLAKAKIAKKFAKGEYGDWVKLKEKYKKKKK